MTTKEMIHAQIDSFQEEDLDELYTLIMSFARSKEADKKESIMSKLRKIKIHGPPDFATNLDLYLSGEKHEKSDLP